MSDYIVAKHHNAMSDEMIAVQDFLGAPGDAVDWSTRTHSNVTLTDNVVWKSGTSFTGTLDHAATANRIYTFPDRALTIGNAADLTGTVPLASLSGITNTEIAAGAAIAYSKLALTGSIVNADISGSAAIAYSKLNLTGTLVNADVSGSAAIAYPKLNLTGTIVNADVSASAAIAYSKLNLATSIVNADISAAAAIAWTKVSKTGSSLADLDTRSAGDLTSGTLADARLSTDVMQVDVIQTVTAAKTFSTLTLVAPNIVNTGTLTLPTSTDTLVGRATTDTLTNKTINSATIGTPTVTGGSWGGGTFTTATLTSPTINGTVATTGLTMPGFTLAGNIAAGTNKVTGLGQGTASGEAVHAGRSISTGTGLSGGGDLTADRTLILANTAVTPGTYTFSTVTVDAQGRLTSASSGATPATSTPQYLTLATTADLGNERRFVDGTGLTATDGGAGADYTLDWDGVTVELNTATPTTKRTINFEEGSGIDLTLDTTADPTKAKLIITATGAASAGGWTDSGTVVELTTVGDRVALGMAAGSISGDSDVKLHVSNKILADANLEWKSGTSFVGALDHAATADRVYTFPDASITIAGINRAQTWTAIQTFTTGLLVAPDIVTGAATLTVPTSTSTLLSRISTDTGANRLQNKDLSDDSVLFVDEADTSKKLAFQLSGITTATTRTLTVADLSGTIALTAGAQTITDKTLDVSNIVTLRDDRFTLQDSADVTKQAVLQLSGITTGTTRTYTLPNATTILVGDDFAQTLTNKTIGASTTWSAAPTVSIGSDATGDIWYRSAGSLFTRLGIGSTGQALVVSGGLPSWGTAGVTVTEVTGVSQSAAVNNAYIANNASAVTVTLPAVFAVGDRVILIGKGAGGWILDAPAGDTIRFNESTVTAAGGTVTSTDDHDTIEVEGTTANATWTVVNMRGNPTVA